MAGDMPFNWRFFPEIGDQVLENGAVEHAAGHVLNARKLAPLHQKDLEPCLGQGVGSSATCGACAYHDDIKRFLHGCRKYSSR